MQRAEGWLPEVGRGGEGPKVGTSRSGMSKSWRRRGSRAATLCHAELAASMDLTHLWSKSSKE